MSSNTSNDSGDVPQIKKVDPPNKNNGVATREASLWNLDDEESVESLPPKIIGSFGEGIPPANLARVPRVLTGLANEKQPQLSQANEELAGPPDHSNNDTKLNIVQRNHTPWPSTQTDEIKNFSREFENLENWVDDGGGVTGKEVEDAIKLAALEVPPSMEQQLPEEAPKEAVEPASVAPEASEVPRQTLAQAVARRHSDYSMLEKFGTAALIFALLAVLAGILIYSATRLPVESMKSREVEFPITGKHVTVRSAKTYWRDVVQSGPQADVVRRGTRMLPILEMSCAGGPGVLRILFRDENGDSVGDNITRQLTGEGNVTIAATAGFNDVGMHAAYRTGESKPWKIEVYEGGEVNVTGDGFIKLFEMDISTERR